MSQNNGLSGELLPCPFCGATEPELITNEHANMSWVACTACGLEAPTETGTSPEDAVAYWNRRASPIQADGLELRTVGWAYRGPRGGLIVTEAKPNHAPEARAVTDLGQAQSALAAMKGERDEAELREGALIRDCEVYKGHATDQLERALKAEARSKALEDALRPFVDYAPDICFLGKSKWTPVETVEAGGGWVGSEDFRRARTVLSESKGEQK